MVATGFGRSVRYACPPFRVKSDGTFRMTNLHIKNLTKYPLFGYFDLDFYRQKKGPLANRRGPN
ncbi:hypothetical protein FUAX_25560 [Fulvitalea axinellae]|uniref:Uncharacterized protein n=1 Tax=Fulvitalea axinellae TaxID=1182444 RepID=A0AAU9CDD9_9BACT|nr:hypothetical protein FUAX_25560 [Fulvitalea axinellae]